MVQTQVVVVGWAYIVYLVKGQLETVEMETRNGKWKWSNHHINVP